MKKILFIIICIISSISIVYAEPNVPFIDHFTNDIAYDQNNNIISNTWAYDENNYYPFVLLDDNGRVTTRQGDLNSTSDTTGNLTISANIFYKIKNKNIYVEISDGSNTYSYKLNSSNNFSETKSVNASKYNILSVYVEDDINGKYIPSYTNYIEINDKDNKEIVLDYSKYKVPVSKIIVIVILSVIFIIIGCLLFIIYRSYKD